VIPITMYMFNHKLCVLLLPRSVNPVTCADPMTVSS
jgi:hypothetical protein